MIDMPTSTQRDLRIPMTTILKLIGSGFGLWAAWLLWPEFLLFLIAILLGMASHVPGGVGVFEGLMIVILKPYFTSGQVLPAITSRPAPSL